MNTVEIAQVAAIIGFVILLLRGILLKNEKMETRGMLVAVGIFGVLSMVLDYTAHIKIFTADINSTLKFISNVSLGIAIGIPIGLKTLQQLKK